MFEIKKQVDDKAKERSKSGSNGPKSKKRQPSTSDWSRSKSKPAKPKAPPKAKKATKRQAEDLADTMNMNNNQISASENV